MDVHVWRNGQAFVWDSEKAASNLAKHGVSFDQACDVFFDRFLQYADASTDDEVRTAAIGVNGEVKLLFVVHIDLGEENVLRLISARPASERERRIYEDGDR